MSIFTQMSGTRQSQVADLGFVFCVALRWDRWSSVQCAVSPFHAKNHQDLGTGLFVTVAGGKERETKGRKSSKQSKFCVCNDFFFFFGNIGGKMPQMGGGEKSFSSEVFDVFIFHSFTL